MGCLSKQVMLAVGLICFVALAMILAGGPQLCDVNGFGIRDLAAYWSSVRLFEQGVNPYDRALTYDLQRSLGIEVERLVAIWNPPIIFPLFLPLTLLDICAAKYLTIALSLAMYIAAVMIARELAGVVGSRSVSGSLLPLLGAFSFQAAICLEYGQLSIALMFCFTCGLYFFYTARQVAAGLCFVPLFIKPHLLYLTGLLLVGEVIDRKQGRVAGACLIGVGCLLGFALAIQPKVLLWWLQTIPNSTQLRSASVVTWVREYGGVWLFDNGVWVVPVVVATLYFVVLRTLRLNHLDRLILSIVLSSLTAPFGWIFDQVVLVPAQILIISKLVAVPLSRRFEFLTLLLFAFSQILFVIFSNILADSAPFIFYPSLILLLWGLTMTGAQNEAAKASQL